MKTVFFSKILKAYKKLQWYFWRSKFLGCRFF